MRLLPLHQVHGVTATTSGNLEWNDTNNEIYISSGSVINVINIRTSKIIKHICTLYKSFPIQCFAITKDHNYLFTVQHKSDHVYFPLITCINIAIEDDNNKYNIKFNDLTDHFKLKSLQFTSYVQAIRIKQNNLILRTKYEIYIIRINFDEIAKLSIAVSDSRKKVIDIDCNITAYLIMPTEICDALFFDNQRFITCGDKHLSMWRFSEHAHNNIDIVRQKFNFGKYKDKDRKKKNERPMTARSAPNQQISPNMHQIMFKLGKMFESSCFQCIALGETEETKESLYVLTKQGILCTFDVQNRSLQKWVNLRMDQAMFLGVYASIIICCGFPDKTRIFESKSLMHLGTLPNKYASLSVVDAMIINGGKKMISLYSNATIIIWNIVVINSSEYEFNVFKCMERNRFGKKQQQMMHYIDTENNLIVSDQDRCLKYISTDIISTYAIPSKDSILQIEQTNVSHIISCEVLSESFIVVSESEDNNETAYIYNLHSMKIKAVMHVTEMIKSKIEEIRVSSRFIGIKPTQSNTIQVIDILNPNQIFISVDLQKSFIDFDFCPHDTAIVLLTKDAVIIHSFDTQQNIYIFTKENNPQIENIKGIKIHPSGKFMIIFLTNSEKIFVWNIEQKCLSRSYSLPDITHRIMFDSTGLYLIAVCNNNNIYIIDWFSGKTMYKGEFHINPVVGIIFCVDSLITVSNDGLIAKWLLPAKMKKAIKDRKHELSATHSIILNSFNELKEIQLQLPGGLEIDDLLGLNDFVEDCAISSVMSSVEIPSMLNLTSKSLESNQEELTEILEQLQILESKQILHNTTDLVDIQIVFDDDEKKENQNDDEKEFPIIIKIMIENNDYDKNTNENENILKNVIKDENEDKDEDENKNENKNENETIINKVTKNEEKEDDNANDSEITMLLSCFTSSIENFARSAEQIYSLRLLLKMKNVSTQDILQRMERNEALKHMSLKSVYNVIEMIEMFGK